MNGTQRIVVAEDHTLVRAGLVEIIDGLPGVAVVGEASTGSAAIVAAAKLKPDLLILDLEMPDTRVLGRGHDQTTREILAASPTTKVVVVTMHDDPDTVRTLILAGASGYLTKTAGPQELEGVLAAAARGGDHVCVAIPRRSFLGISDGGKAAVDLLSHREVEILGLVANGASNRELARELQIAEATVKRHLDRIFKKLDVNSRINAVNRARQLEIM